MIRKMVDLMAHLDEEGRLLDPEGSTSEDLARHVEAMHGRPFPELVHPEERPLVESVMEEARTSLEEPFAVVHRLRVGDRWVRVASRMRFDPVPQGPLRGLLVCCRLRDDPLPAEDALTDDQALSRSIVRHALDIAALVDHRGAIRLVSSAVERSLGYEPDEIVGRGALEIVHPDDRPETSRVLSQVLRIPGLERRHVARVRTSDGEPRTLDVLITSFRARGGETTAVITARDITEQIQAEHRARRSEERLQSVIERAPLVLWEIDAEGTFTLSAGSGLEALGLEAGEVVGRSLFEMYAEHPGILEDTRRALTGERVVSTRRVDGSVFDVHYTPAVGSSGEVIGAVGLAMDVTERQGLEDQLRQAQKMEAVGQLTSGIAHDFNNLLTIILGNLALARSEVPDEAADLAALLEEVENAANSASSVVRKLLAYTRNTTVVPERIDLVEAREDVVDMLRRFLPESMTVEADQGGPDSVVVEVDPVTLDQIALNLGTNARDATGGRGRLAVSVGALRLQPGDERLGPRMAPGDYGSLTFRDDGPGMDEATVRRAFEPFFTTKPKGLGTGLGLSMVYGLTEQQGGRALLETAPGEGMAVTLLLPRASGETDRAESPDRTSDRAWKVPGPLAASPAGTETILFVEDEEAIRRTATRALERFGYDVIPAADAFRACEILRDQGRSVALVVTDLVMPRMGGADLVRWIEEELDHDIPVLLTTGYVDGGSLTGFHVGRGRRLLQKPWTVDGLLGSVRDVLDEVRAGPS